MARRQPRPDPGSPNIPLPPKPGHHHYTGNGGSGGSSGSGGGSTPATPTSSASSEFNWSKNHQLAQEAKAQRTADAADRASLSNILSQAGLVKQQIAALKIQLGDKGFRQALETHLANALKEYRQADQALMHGFHDKAGQLAGSAADNEKSAGDQAFANLANRIRERTSATANTALQGAGETDTLRAQQMSLRNWDANQSDISRSYFDTLRSANSALSDLNVDTATARVNAMAGLNERRGSLWDQYFSQRADAWDKIANLGGTLGQLYGQAHGISANPESATYDHGAWIKERDAAEGLSARALRHSSQMTGKAYDDPGIPKRLMNWDGRDDFAQLGPQQGAIRANSRGSQAPEPEGATLRQWAS